MSSKNKGLTLIELQIATAISAILIIAVVSLYIFYWKCFSIGNAALDVYSNSRVAMGWLVKDVKSAAEVLPNSTITSGYATSNSCIVLQVPSITGSPGSYSVVPSQFDEIIYRVQSGDLHRIVCPNTSGATPSSRASADVIVSDHCNSVTFYKVDTSAGTWTSLSSFTGSGGNLSTVNNIGVSLPINETVLSLGGVSTENILIAPTMVIRLRNK